ncbi:hypothetical protein AO501_10615 [Mycobacterium gordonae]|uniref:DUF4381 domain-containing protein n=1 Tax=Mycobacterium gordonae TaxID=1778 RepID=A0A0Q2LVC3_MYCGO|nr:hypothetical protein [Mycobacterium gordonae]KQH79841.1 hypothetical protein AO501_10615 [Mycobacterium gordonae]
MPGDLLRYLGAPTGFPGWWWLVVAGCLIVVVGWFGGLYIWTLPPARLRRTPVLSVLHRRLLRRRFTRSITRAVEEHRAGHLSPAQAAAQMNHTLRSFLHLSTGARVQYLHIDAISASTELLAAAPVLSALSAAQFSPDPVDVAGVARQAQQVIRAWT